MCQKALMVLALFAALTGCAGAPKKATECSGSGWQSLNPQEYTIAEAPRDRANSSFE